MKHTKTRTVTIQGFEWEYAPYYLGGAPYVCMSEITRLYREHGNQKMREIMDRSKKHGTRIFYNVSSHEDFVAIHELDWMSTLWGGNSIKFNNATAILNWNSDEHEAWCPENTWLAFCGWLTGAYGITEFTHFGKTLPIERLSSEEMVVEDLLERYLAETPSELSTLSTASEEHLSKLRLAEMEREIRQLRAEVDKLKQKERMRR